MLLWALIVDLRMRLAEFWALYKRGNYSERPEIILLTLCDNIYFLFFYFFISLIADGPRHYHPACGHWGSSHLSPVHALHFFIAMQVQHSYNSSTKGWILLTHVPTLSVMKERTQILLCFGENRTHDFRTTSRWCAGYLLFRPLGRRRRPYVWSSPIARVWINRVRLPILLVVSWTGKMNIPLSPCVPENLVSRDGFSRPVPRQPAHLHIQAESGADLRDPSRVPRQRPFTKLPYATGSVPSLSGHAIAYRWRSLPRVRRYRASKPQGSFERVLPCLADHHGPINIRLSFPHSLTIGMKWI